MNGDIILIGDDDETDIFFLRQALLEYCPGCTVFEVSDGEEAMDYLAGRGRHADRKTSPVPTRVFLDIKMPKRSGMDVLRWLRAQAAIAGIPVVILSGSGVPAEIKEAKLLGADYIVKPVDYDGLRRIIAGYFRGPGPQTGARR